MSTTSVQLTNLLPAINGSDGFATGTASTAHVKYATSTLLLTGTTGSAETTSATTSSYTLDSSHLYYARVEVYQETVVGETSVYWPIAEPPFYSGQQAVAGQWTIVGAVNNRSSFTSGNYQFRLDFDNDSQAGSMWFDGVMLIDLTAAFGSGNEPDTAWCHANIPYFTGTTTLTIGSNSDSGSDPDATVTDGRIVKQSDLTGWYTTLNAIRSKNGLSTVTAATFSGTEPVAYSKISSLITQVNALKSNTYLGQATYSDFSDIKSGGPVALETVTDLEDTFASLKQICTNKANNSKGLGNSTDYYDGNATNTTDSNESDAYCITEATTYDAADGQVYNNTNNDYWNAGNGDYTHDLADSDDSDTQYSTVATGAYSDNSDDSTRQSTYYDEGYSTNTTNSNDSNNQVKGNSVHNL